MDNEETKVEETPEVVTPEVDVETTPGVVETRPEPAVEVEVTASEVEATPAE